MSSRLNLLTAMVSLWEDLPQYKVMRGAVNWGIFPFDQFPYAVAIMQDKGDFASMFNKPFDNGDFTFEIFAQTTDTLNDDTQDKLLSDAKAVIRGLSRHKDAQGDASMLRAASLQWVEVFDSARGVQGIVVTFTASY